MDQFDAQATMLEATTALEQVKGDVVTQTLDKLNGVGNKKSRKGNPFGSMEQTYNFSQSVLSAAYEGKGTIIDSKP